MDAFHLARLQFGFTVAFHIVFPAFSIGLASYLMVLEGLWLKTGKQVYLDLFKYWIKIFSIGFAMGVVSGLGHESYEFGTNWSQYADKAGPVIGPVMAYEVLTAFFSKRASWASCCSAWNVWARLALLCDLHGRRWARLLSAFLDPVGQQLDADTGRASRIGAGRQDVFPRDYWKVIFNPSVFVRVPHMVLASYLIVAFIVGGVGAWHLLAAATGRPACAQTMLSMAHVDGGSSSRPLQIGMGDLHGLNTLEHQPMKIAAMEGDWEPSGSSEGAPLMLFGLPDMDRQRTDYKIADPHLSSLILTHSWDGRQFPALKQVRAGRPTLCAGRVLDVP